MLQLALRLHHSILSGRKINVEFTSAGKKTTQRQQKLKLKNKAAGRFKMSQELWNAPGKGKRMKVWFLCNLQKVDVLLLKTAEIVVCTVSCLYCITFFPSIRVHCKANKSVDRWKKNKTNKPIAMAITWCDYNDAFNFKKIQNHSKSQSPNISLEPCCTCL